MKVCICDDLAEELEALKSACETFFEERNIQAEIVCTQDPEHPINHEYDILILDVEMPKKKGTVVKDQLMGKERPLIIFATSYQENMPDAFGPNVIGFLAKPLVWESFELKMDLAVRLLMAGRILEISPSLYEDSEKIIMFFTEQRYTKALLASGGQTPLSAKSLSAWEKELEDLYFVRVDSSHLVNCKHIVDAYDDIFVLRGGQKLKVSRRRKKECFEKLRQYNLRFSKFA
ncbi:LytTR family DNA-binding domain-containing protein [Anaerovoracaceae bacterium 42-11]